MRLPLVLTAFLTCSLFAAIAPAKAGDFYYPDSDDGSYAGSAAYSGGYRIRPRYLPGPGYDDYAYEPAPRYRPYYYDDDYASCYRRRIKVYDRYGGWVWGHATNCD
ncbi:MAG TPA: hypothetical protein VFB45_24810 [Pseudolabrys sp.]|nr:hypothetical protein [Pseudolabrys sp.]